MGMNILLVDDSDVIRAMIGKTLRLAQVPLGTLFEASNGKEALDVLRNEWVDLVLADINMPVMTGTEMIGHMRDHPEMRDIPVIVISTEGATDRVSELMRRGVSAWVRKPFTPEEIRDVIANVAEAWSRETDHSALLDEVMDSVLETFAFAYPVQTATEELPDGGEQLVCATIIFNGAASGTMSVAAPADLCAALAANILGADPDGPDAFLRGPDTLGEILNIAAGHMATYVNPDTPTDLHPPVVTRMVRAEWDTATSKAGTRGYLVEDRPMLVSLGLRPSSAC